MTSVHRAAQSPVPVRVTRFLAFSVFTLFMVALVSAPLSAEELLAEETIVAEPVAVAAPANQQLWMVSTRYLPLNVSCTEEEFGFRYWRHDGEQWLESNQQEFVEADQPGVPTSVLIPGAPVTESRTFRLGTASFDAIRSMSPDSPLRMVIWAWPSDLPCGRKLRGYRTLVGRCDDQAYYVASFVDQYLSDCPVCLVGYSFGARISTGVLELMAGGRLSCCPAYTCEHVERPPMNAVLLAAAMDTWWLNTNGRHALALSQVDRILVTVNRCDSTLEKYHFLYQLRKGPVALGQYGVGRKSRLGEYASRYEELNVNPYVGSTHDPEPYLSSPEILAPVAALVFFEDAPVPAE